MTIDQRPGSATVVPRLDTSRVTSVSGSMRSGWSSTGGSGSAVCSVRRPAAPVTAWPAARGLSSWSAREAAARPRLSGRSALMVTPERSSQERRLCPGRYARIALPSWGPPGNKKKRTIDVSVWQTSINRRLLCWLDPTIVPRRLLESMFVISRPRLSSAPAGILGNSLQNALFATSPSVIPGANAHARNSRIDKAVPASLREQSQSIRNAAHYEFMATDVPRNRQITSERQFVFFLVAL